MKALEDGFTSHVLDLLAEWDDVSARRMFSGQGLFFHGLMFAIIFDDVLYLKDFGEGQSEPTSTHFKRVFRIQPPRQNGPAQILQSP